MRYRIELAVSGGGKCRGSMCKDKAIPKDSLRFGTWTEGPHFNGWNWRHWGCVTYTQISNLKKSINVDTFTDEESFNKVGGFQQLTGATKEKVRQALVRGGVDNKDWNGWPEYNRPFVVNSPKPICSPAPAATSNMGKKVTLPLATVPSSKSVPSPNQKAKKTPMLRPLSKENVTEEDDETDDDDKFSDGDADEANHKATRAPVLQQLSKEYVSEGEDDTEDDDDFIDDNVDEEDVETDADETADEEDEEEEEEEFEDVNDLLETDHHTEKIAGAREDEIETDEDDAEQSKLITPPTNKNPKSKRENKRLSNSGPLQPFSPRSPLSPQPRTSLKPAAPKEKDILASLKPEAKQAVTLLVERLTQLEEAESAALEPLLSSIKNLCIDKPAPKELGHSEEEEVEVNAKAKPKGRGKSKEKEKEERQPTPAKAKGKSSAKVVAKRLEMDREKEKEHAADPGAVSRAVDPASLKVPELKAELKKLGLSCTGLKKDLVERLREALEKAG